jgi:hypothetical protein
VRRFLPVLALAAVLLMAAPAWAHEEINPSTIPTGTPVFFSLNAANEKTVDLTRITLTAPSGLAFGEATRSPAGWKVDRTEEVITWTGAAVAPEQFEQWGFEIEGADQPGSISYKVTLGFADGTSDDVEVVVTATDATGPSDSAASPASGKSDNGNAGGAYALGAVALVVAVVAVVLTRRNAGPPSTSASTPAGDAKDW